MSEDALIVAVRGAVVGDLARADSTPGAASFRYRHPATQDQAVSLTMPVRRDDYLWDQGLHPIFEMNLPEGYLKSRLQQMFSKVIQGFDDLDLLSIVGPHQLGRVIVGGRSDGTMPGTSINELLVHDGARGLFEDLVSRYARYSGVSGFATIGTKMLNAWNAGVTRSLMSEKRAKVIDMGAVQKPAPLD